MTKQTETIRKVPTAPAADLKPTRDTYIRNLDNELYHQIRVTAVNRRMAIGEIVNEAMRMWLAAQRSTD